MVINASLISVVHRTWLVPKGYDDDPDYFSGQYMDDFLNIMGVHSANAIAGELEEEYFYDWQLGSQEEMTPGIVDVSVYMATLTMNFIKPFRWVSWVECTAHLSLYLPNVRVTKHTGLLCWATFALSGPGPHVTSLH